MLRWAQVTLSSTPLFSLCETSQWRLRIPRMFVKLWLVDRRDVWFSSERFMSLTSLSFCFIIVRKTAKWTERLSKITLKMSLLICTVPLCERKTLVFSLRGSLFSDHDCPIARHLAEVIPSILDQLKKILLPITGVGSQQSKNKSSSILYVWKNLRVKQEMALAEVVFRFLTRPWDSQEVHISSQSAG